jgi:hypothetical protein
LSLPHYKTTSVAHVLSEINLTPFHVFSSRFILFYRSSCDALIPSGFQIQIAYGFIIFPIRSSCCAYLILRYFETLLLFGEAYKSWSFLLRSFSPPSSYCLPFCFKYLYSSQPPSVYVKGEVACPYGGLRIGYKEKENL